ncbi:MAG: hypothetical protein K2G21_10840, partial [Muribaculaceae bacterium]|nr:hypothetical protein [Muribaculaceae bacterium]
MMKRLSTIFASLFIAAVAPLAMMADDAAPAATADTEVAVENTAAAGHHEAEEDFKPKDIIFEHLGDGYGWEVPFNHHKRIPLPYSVWA